MSLSRKFFVLLLSSLCIKHISFSQCLIPSPEGDTLMPVTNRMIDLAPGYAPTRSGISRITSKANMAYIAGSFQNIGPNTGSGVVLNDNAAQIFTPKKWRINGPVYASAPDGNGGYFIGGYFSKIGDSTRNYVAHINSNGVPSNWNPKVDDYVGGLAIYNDTILIGGRFTTVNGQSRISFAMVNAVSGSVLPAVAANNALKKPVRIHTFRLVDSILYVGGNLNTYNLVGSVFKINVKSGGTSNFPNTYQMEDVFAIDISPSKRKLYIGGHAGGGLATSNGYCIDLNTNGLLFKIDVGIVNGGDVATIYALKNYGGNVYAGGKFNFGIINGSNFNKKGLVAFDTATGAIRNVLNNCDGYVTSIHARDKRIYFGGDFNSLDGTNRMNLAIYDTVLKTIVTSSLGISDEIKTISFTGSNMFVGGLFQSVGCVSRNGLAAFDINTGQISSWLANFYANTVTDMKVKGDTIFMSGSFGTIPGSTNLGGIIAVNATTGSFYTSGLNTPASCYNLLINDDYIYTSGLDPFGNSFLAKFYIPTLTRVNNWSPAISFQIKSIQKRSGRIYGAGDRYDNNIRKGFLSEINDTTGKVIRTVDLNPLPSSTPGNFDWIAAGVLAENKFFLFGSFGRVLYSSRQNFAVFDIDKWEVNPIDIKVSSVTLPADLQFKNGNIYFSGQFDKLNNKDHRYFAVIDTSVGAIFPDRLKFNDDPYNIENEVSYDGVYNFLLSTDYMIAAGNFRNVSKRMFPSLAKLKVNATGQLTKPQSITGPDTVLCPSQNNVFHITNPNPEHRYAWFVTGRNMTIKNNGTDSILLDIGPLASPGVLKAIALSECGRSDTIYHTIKINTTEPTVNASNIVVIRKTDTTATVRFTRGNGARRLVVVRAVNSINNVAQDKQEYIANASFGAGSNLGNNSYIVYSADADSASIKQLNPDTYYYITVFEYNGADSTTNYLTTGNPSISFTTMAARPTVHASLQFSNITQTSMTITATPGNGGGRLIVMRVHPSPDIFPVNANGYTASSVLGNGTDLGNGNYVVSNSISPVTVTNLTPGTHYRVKAYEYNGTGPSTTYITSGAPEQAVRTIAVEPTVQASNIVISAITPTTATINCTPGNGTGRIVLIRKDSTVVFVPKDSVMYGPNVDLGGNTYLVSGSSTPVNVSGLIPRTKYYVAIFEFNGTIWNHNYVTTSVPVTSFTTGDNKPTIQASNLTVTSITATTAFANCTSGNGSNRLFVIREGNPVIDTPVNGTHYPVSNGYVGGTNLGHLTYVIAREQPVNIASLLPGRTYYLKVFEYSGSGSSASYLVENAPTLSFTTPGGSNPGEPTTQASNISVAAISPNAATINCTPGNGQSRLVVIRQSNSLSSVPIDGKSYNANTFFGSGDTVGFNNTYVISNTSTPITVTGLLPETEYTVSVFEYSGTGTQINYLTTGNSFSTFKTLVNKPTIASSAINFSSISTSSVTINCTPGNGQSRLIVIKKGAAIIANPADGTGYDANTAFGSGSNLGDLTFVVSNTTAPVTITGLQPQTQYTVKVFEYNGSSTTASYLTTGNAASFSTSELKAQEPSQQAANITMTAITSNSAMINCIPGDGQNRLVVITAGNNISASPFDKRTYTANSVFGSGDTIGSNTYVIANTSTPVTVTGLTPGTVYSVTVFEFNGSGSQVNYLTTGNSVSTFTTLANKPTIASSGINFSSISSFSVTVSCTPGNGQSRLVVIKQGAAITANPADGTGYDANTVFGSGSNIGDQSFVVSNTAAPVTITGLQPQTQYTVKVFEYNGASATASYLITGTSNAASFSTSALIAQEPGQQASNITVTGITSSSATINCISGNGQNRLVVIAAGNSISSAPVDNTSYAANSVFGSAATIGTNTYVISNTSTPVTVTGLMPGAVYTVTVFEYNGNGSQVNYLTTGNAVTTFTTPLTNKPTIAASNIVVESITSSSAKITCTPGNGQARLVVIKKGPAITASPADGTSYTANTVFGNGSDISDQSFVIATGTTPVTVTGLESQTQYTVQVIEYNGSGSTSTYLVDNWPSASFTTASPRGVVNLDGAAASVEFYPNPVTSNKLNLVFRTAERGNLTVSAYSTTATRILTTVYSITSDVTNINVTLPANLQQGTIIIKCQFLGGDASFMVLKP